MEMTKTKWYKRIGWTGIVLCGLCCSLPIIGAAVGLASLTVLSTYLEKIGILALGLAAFSFWYAWYGKRKKRNTCSTSCEPNCECKSEIPPQSK